jgi:DNA segregation ATPase FtsK/SpoIIIE, S-DNA-T family
VVTDPKDAAGVLKWAVLEMERRYALLSANGVRSIGEFNTRVRQGVVIRRSEVDGPDGAEGDPDRWIHRDGILPFIVLVVDELADLMMAVQGEVERPLTLLAQKARAIGIHIILATQRPSVNVITGLIKANFPCRIAFRVASKTDSRTILDQNGADALLGNGDMLFLPPGQSEPGAHPGGLHPHRGHGGPHPLVPGGGRRPAGRSWRPGRRGRPREEEDILEVVRAHEAREGGEGRTGPSPGTGTSSSSRPPRCASSTSRDPPRSCSAA